MFSRRLPRDVDDFLNEYPDLPVGDPDVDDGMNRNLCFYTNVEKCEPDDMLIDDIHKEWWGDYDLLEYNHGYIQWLFPIREYGMNYHAQPLQPREITAMKADDQVIERVIKSYRMMLDFYGMQLLDQDTGLVCRSEGYERRYRNLSRSSHNNLRITRILKCLSELELERLSAGFLLHILVEQSTHRMFGTSTIQSSMDRFWLNCIRNDREREWIGELTHRVRRGRLGFERDDYERVMLVRQKKGHFDWKMDMEEDGEEIEEPLAGLELELELELETEPQVNEESEGVNQEGKGKKVVESDPELGPDSGEDVVGHAVRDTDAMDKRRSPRGALNSGPATSVLDESSEDDNDDYADDVWDGLQDEDCVKVDGDDPDDDTTSPSPETVGTPEDLDTQADGSQVEGKGAVEGQSDGEARAEKLKNDAPTTKEGDNTKVDLEEGKKGSERQLPAVPPPS